jgi:hypothetical protein
MGRNCTGTCVVRVGGEFVHERIIVGRIMVEKAELLGAGLIGQTNPAYPGRMTPTLPRRQLFLGESGIVNNQIGILSQRQKLIVSLAGIAFGIADDREYASAVFEPIAACSVGMIQGCGAQRRAVSGMQHIA